MPAHAGAHGDHIEHGPDHEPRPTVALELELERRARTRFHAAERGGLQWRRRSPNLHPVAHRRGNR
jgi:hypothetical protein